LKKRVGKKERDTRETERREKRGRKRERENERGKRSPPKKGE